MRLECENGCVRLRVSIGVAMVAMTGLSGCKEMPPGIPLEQLNPQQMHGHAVFQEACGRCHSDRTSQGLHGPPLLGMYRKPYLPSGAPANDERVLATILHGRNMMPAFGDKMDPQDLDDLMAYLHTL